MKFDRVLLHLRKSRSDIEAEARGEGETLAKHEKFLLKYAKENNINIIEVRKELESGEFLVHRPKMLLTLSEVENGLYDGVLCMDIDRLGRGNKQDQGIILETFKNSNTKIITPRKVYDLSDEWDEEYVDFEQFMAHKELRYINRRLQRGRIASIENGNYLSPLPPYGWLIKSEGRGNRYLIPHPDQGPVVKMIYTLYNEDDPDKWKGSTKIADELNIMNIPSYSGKPWDPSAVLNIIKNPVNCGYITWKKKEIKKSLTPGKKKDCKTRPKEDQIIVKGKHYPGLIPEEEYVKAQTRLSSKYHVPYQLVNGIKNPLAGLIRCDICGASMVLRPYSHQQYPHLICQHCSNKSTRFMHVEDKLIQGLREWLAQYKADWKRNQKVTKKVDPLEFLNKSLFKLEKDLEEISNQKSSLHDFLEKGIYSTEIFLERSKILADRTEVTEKAIQEVQSRIESERNIYTANEKIIPLLENIIDVYYKTDDPGQRNALMKSVLNYATYRKEKHQKNDDFTLVLYPRLHRDISTNKAQK